VRQLRHQVVEVFAADRRKSEQRTEQLAARNEREDPVDDTDVPGGCADAEDFGREGGHRVRSDLLSQQAAYRYDWRAAGREG
jgi:hypothetical protein